MGRQQRRQTERMAKKADRQKTLSDSGHTGPMYDVGQPVPAKTHRRMQTKGTPFCNCKIIDVIMGKSKGVPATIKIKHPTSKSKIGHIRKVAATPEIIKALMPAANQQQISTLMGY